MYLEQAKTIEDWQTASSLLLDVMDDLNSKNLTLWTESQLILTGLQKQYKPDELYLARNDGVVEGVVFLQEEDPYFWPEITTQDTLFLHKLAIHPQQKGLKKDEELIKLVANEAFKRGLKWLRLDCDDRKPLHQFYTKNGFALVDVIRLECFDVARYQKNLYQEVLQNSHLNINGNMSKTRLIDQKKLQLIADIENPEDKPISISNTYDDDGTNDYFSGTIWKGHSISVL